MGAPRENPITSEPATVDACTTDRDQAGNGGDAREQLGSARTEGNVQAGTR